MCGKVVEHHTDPFGQEDPSLPPPARLFVFSFYDVPNPQVFLAQVLDWLDDREVDDTRQRPRYHEIKARLKQEQGLLRVLDGLEKVQDDGLRGGRLGHVTDASRPLRILNIDRRAEHIAAFLTAAGTAPLVRQVEMMRERSA